MVTSFKFGCCLACFELDEGEWLFLLFTEMIFAQMKSLSTLLESMSSSWALVVALSTSSRKLHTVNNKRCYRKQGFFGYWKVRKNTLAKQTYHIPTKFYHFWQRWRWWWRWQWYEWQSYRWGSSWWSEWWNEKKIGSNWAKKNTQRQLLHTSTDYTEQVKVQQEEKEKKKEEEEETTSTTASACALCPAESQSK